MCLKVIKSKVIFMKRSMGYERLKTKKGKRTYHLRMQSVEPVFGSLQQYYGLRRIYVRGKSSAFKVMLMSASAFNVKKWLKNLVQYSEKYAVNSFISLSYPCLLYTSPSPRD